MTLGVSHSARCQACSLRRILGIDPGSRITGYGVIENAGQGVSYCASGCIRPRSDSLPSRLGEIYRGVSDLIDRYHPDEFAIESVFMARNPQSALKLGQARGVAIAAAVAADEPARAAVLREVLGELLARRGARYREVADLSVDGARDPEDVAQDVLEWALGAGDVLTPSEHEQVMT